MVAAMRIALLAVAAMAVLSTASAVTYTVGDPAGEWGLGIDYGSWVSSKKFLTGDSIVFKYSPQAHDVLEVSKADYDSCTTANPITSFQTGNDNIALSAAGTRYFICGFAGHCTTTGTGGMKVQINVMAGSSPSPPTPANAPSAGNSPPPSPPAPASGPGASNPPPSPQASSAATSAGATAGLGLVVLLAGLMI